ncbi:aspartyl/asparaginyl beta-hydroxylase domain-containing protein [Myxococcota bacterium]|nr:aspartyl/asparaginyl beta-hydroxylase domain-containing protein [Myxococcota bacterium]
MMYLLICTAILFASGYVVFRWIDSLDSDQKDDFKSGVNRFWERAEEKGHFKAIPGFELDCYRDYPRLKILQDHYKEIAEECDRLLELRDGMVQMQEIGGSYTSGDTHSLDWKTFMFKSGKFIEENCRHAPRTTDLLRKIPGVYTAFFSVLEPRQHIAPHWGYYKGFVRYHLGISIPYDNTNGECYIRVNSDPEVNRGRQFDRIGEGDIYYWKNGEGVVFDDTHMHEAFNDSDRVRVVLFMDLRRSMPFYLQWLNWLFLFVAHNDGSVKSIRQNARFGA